MGGGGGGGEGEGEGGGVSKTECLHVQWDTHVRADGRRS